MNNEILPIGSIITVDNKDLMICSYVDEKKTINNQKFDYICCFYPIGFQKDAILVNKDNISDIKFIGFQDNRFAELKKELEQNNE